MQKREMKVSWAGTKLSEDKESNNDGNNNDNETQKAKTKKNNDNCKQVA